MHDPIDVTVWRHPKVKRPIYVAIDHRDDRTGAQLADECDTTMWPDLVNYLDGTHDALFIAAPLLRDGATRVHLTVDRGSVDELVSLLDPLVVWATSRWLDRTAFGPRACPTCSGWDVVKTAVGTSPGPCTRCDSGELAGVWDLVEVHLELNENAHIRDTADFLDC